MEPIQHHVQRVKSTIDQHRPNPYLGNDENDGTSQHSPRQLCKTVSVCAIVTSTGIFRVEGLIPASHANQISFTYNPTEGELTKAPKQPSRHNTRKGTPPNETGGNHSPCGFGR